jgi:hypothetical protein
METTETERAGRRNRNNGNRESGKKKWWYYHYFCIGEQVINCHFLGMNCSMTGRYIYIYWYILLNNIIRQRYCIKQ